MKKLFVLLLSLFVLANSITVADLVNDFDLTLDMEGYKRTNRIDNKPTEDFIKELNEKNPGNDIDDFFGELSDDSKREIIAYYTDKAWDAYIQTDNDIQQVLSLKQRDELKRSFKVSFYKSGKLTSKNQAGNVAIPMEFGDGSTEKMNFSGFKRKENSWYLSVSYDAFSDSKFTPKMRIAKFAHELIGHGMVRRYMEEVVYAHILDSCITKKTAPKTLNELAFNPSWNDVTNEGKKAIHEKMTDIRSGKYAPTSDEKKIIMQVSEGIAVSVENGVHNVLTQTCEKTIDFVKREYATDNTGSYAFGVQIAIDRGYNIDSQGGIIWIQLLSIAQRYK